MLTLMFFQTGGRRSQVRILDGGTDAGVVTAALNLTSSSSCVGGGGGSGADMVWAVAGPPTSHQTIALVRCRWPLMAYSWLSSMVGDDFVLCCSRWCCRGSTSRLCRRRPRVRT